MEFRFFVVVYWSVLLELFQKMCGSCFSKLKHRLNPFFVFPVIRFLLLTLFRLVKDITIEDLNEDDMKCLQCGTNQILPQRDHADRPIYCVVTVEDKSLYDSIAMVRAHIRACVIQVRMSWSLFLLGLCFAWSVFSVQENPQFLTFSFLILVQNLTYCSIVLIGIKQWYYYELMMSYKQRVLS